MKKKYGVYEQFYESNCFGMMEIIDKQPRKFLVRFVDTGYETWAERGNVLAGKVNDPIAKEQKLEEWLPCQEEFINNSGHKLTVFLKRGKKVKVLFENTGYTTEAFIDNVKAGKIKDPYEKSFLGLGYIGEFKKVVYWKQAKQLWCNVMKRCYNPKDQQGYYGKAFVDVRWHCFANFLEDLPKLENFDKWLVGGDTTKDRYNLDKDTKFTGNRIYSKETCMFITEHENKSAGAVNARLLDKVNGRCE